jgi:formylglycine-generating enzyme required for sulfatase activity
MTQVFISYSRKDLAFVEHLAEDLKAAGLEVWYDLSGLDGGTRWGREIQRAIQQSQIFVVVLSPNSIDSEWVEKEFMYANSLKRKIIPLLYQPCETPMWFINLHFIDVQGSNYDSHFWVILKAMGIQPGDGKTKEKPASAAPEIQTPPEPPLQPLPQGNEPEKSSPAFRFRPIWIITLGGLAAVLALAVWGMPRLTARLAPTSPPIATVASTPTFAPTNIPTPMPTSTPTVVPTPTLGIVSTWIRPVDGMLMVYVRAGSFMMGSPDGTGNTNEHPRHSVTLNAFWIDKTEVTNAMYAVCVQKGTCQVPHETKSSTRASYYGNSAYENYPVIAMDWNLAAVYCRWAGARLPTEAEWEKAARGTDERTYPWGNGDPNKDLLNYNSNVGDTTAVGSYPSGTSPYGALDMAGNVWEWVNDWYDENYYANSSSSNPQGPSSGQYRVLRGGIWRYGADLVRSANRNWNDPAIAGPNFGFRCSRSQ